MYLIIHRFKARGKHAQHIKVICVLPECRLNADESLRWKVHFWLWQQGNPVTDKTVMRDWWEGLSVKMNAHSLPFQIINKSHCQCKREAVVTVKMCRSVRLEQFIPTATYYWTRTECVRWHSTHYPFHSFSWNRNWHALSRDAHQMKQCHGCYNELTGNFF